MRLNNMWNAFIVLAISFTCVAAQKFDCNAGCSLDPTLSGQPVCGADGLVYASACLAFCQGVSYGSGTCAGEGDRGEQIDLSGQTEVITLEIMNRFAKESFRFVTKQTEFSMEPIRDDFLYGSNIFSPQDTPNGLNSVRVTREGYKFISQLKSFATVQGPTEASLGSVAENEPRLRKRNLAVLGEDTRSAVPETTISPYRTIGALDYTWGDNGCTVTMISKTSGITAGHCLYDVAAKKDRPLIRFAPGRYNNLAEKDNTTEPYGLFDVDYATTFQGFMDTGHEYFDMGVVTFKKRKRRFLGLLSVYPGEVVGTLAMDRVVGTSNSVNDPRLSTMTVTGYPYDAEDGQMMTSGLCPTPPQSVSGNYIYHTCDTMPGMSGSVLLTSGNVILGVHNGSHRPPGGEINGGTVLNAEYFDIVAGWAGITGQSPQTCTCSEFGRRRLRRLICGLRNYSTCFGRSQSSQ